MATQDALQTMGMTSDAAQRQAQVNDTNDIAITPSKSGAQLDKGPSAKPEGPKLTSGLPTPKRANFSASKEDPKLLEKMADSKNEVAGQVNGMGAFIDGYLRIQKRKYGSRGQYGIISKGYRL